MSGRPPGATVGRLGALLGLVGALATLNYLARFTLEDTGAGEEQGLVPDEWRPDDAAPFAANLALTAVGVPIVEELTFRGAGYSLLSRYGRGVAIVGTAVIFGLAHGLVLALPVLVAFGLGLAWLRSRSGSVYPGMLLHGSFNAVAVLVSVFG